MIRKSAIWSNVRKFFNVNRGNKQQEEQEGVNEKRLLFCFYYHKSSYSTEGRLTEKEISTMSKGVAFVDNSHSGRDTFSSTTSNSSLNIRAVYDEDGRRIDKESLNIVLSDTLITKPLFDQMVESFSYANKYIGKIYNVEVREVPRVFVEDDEQLNLYQVDMDNTLNMLKVKLDGEIFYFDPFGFLLNSTITDRLGGYNMSVVGTERLLDVFSRINVEMRCAEYVSLLPLTDKDIDLVKEYGRAVFTLFDICILCGIDTVNTLHDIRGVKRAI